MGAALGLSVCGSGCALLDDRKSSEYSTISTASADTNKARNLNAKGVELFQKGKLDKAERHFRDALISDVDFGPAHNNLGHLYLAQKQLYLAAWEFELAANTMPNRFEPQLNLGLVYQQAKRFDQAEEFYRMAYSQAPQNADTIGYLVRLLVLVEGDKYEINRLLHELLTHESREDWQCWANELLATRYSDQVCCTIDTGIDPESQTDSMPLAEPNRSTPTESLPLPMPQPVIPAIDIPLPAPTVMAPATQAAPMIQATPAVQAAPIIDLQSYRQNGVQARSTVTTALNHPPATISELYEDQMLRSSEAGLSSFLQGQPNDRLQSAPPFREPLTSNPSSVAPVRIGALK